MISKAIPFIIALACVSLLALQNSTRIKIIQSTYDIESPPPLSELSPNITNIFTLGFKNIYDDFISIWIMQSLVDSRKRDPEKLIRSIRQVVKHEPKLETTYMLSCFVLLKDFKRPDVCKEIILAGLNAFPKSWRLPMTQGYVSYYLLNDSHQAATFFMMAASRPQSPQYVQSLVKKLLKQDKLNADDIESSIQLLDKYGGSSTFKEILESIQDISKNSPSKAE